MLLPWNSGYGLMLCQVIAAWLHTLLVFRPGINYDNIQRC
jgi:hypothetical protein